jgi:DNA polymerase-3 subunit delta
MIYFFYGDEEFNISQEVKGFRDKLDKNFIEMSYKTYKNPKFPDLIAILKSQPMMFGKMLIVIDCVNYLCGKKSEESGFDDKQLAELSQALEDCNENLDVIFIAYVSPDDQKKKKIDKRRKIFKLLSKYNSKEFLQLPSYKTEEYETWIKKQAGTKDLKLSNEVASEILLQVGINLRTLDSELEKLKVYAGDKPVTKDMVKEICTTGEDLFSFTNALIVGDTQKALEEYQKILVKKHPLEILATLHTILRQNIQIKAYNGKYSQYEIAQMIKINPKRIPYILQEIKNVPLKNLVRLKKNLTDAEYKIKIGQSAMEPEREVEYAILR